MTTNHSLAELDRAFADHFGHPPVRASVSFVGVEPIEVLRFEPIPGERVYLSFGMSRHPMTAASELLQSPDGPRAELMLHLQDPADRFADVWRQLAILAAAPVVEGVVYAPGMTVDLGQALVPASGCTGVVVMTSPLDAVPTARGDVDVLQVTPATPNELAWSRVKGSGALIELWATQGTPLLQLDRASVSLD